MKNRYSLYSAIVLLVLILSSCAGEGDNNEQQEELPVLNETFPADGSDNEVLILSYGTVFKEQLRANLIEDLNGKGFSVTVDSRDGRLLRT